MSRNFRHWYLYIRQDDLDVEKKQCEDEGKDISSLISEFERVRKLDLEDFSNQIPAYDLLDKTSHLPIKKDYPYKEPSDLEGIRAERIPAPKIPRLKITDKDLEDKIYGAWLGRVCGCLLGKPVEGWLHSRMSGYLKDTNRLPLSDYFSINVPDKIKDKYKITSDRPFIETVKCMPEDDDTNYTVIGLNILKRYGAEFTPLDVANFWMESLPILHTATAERLAYRNFCLLIEPPQSASFRNPYREWIGAQIRADCFGYATPGKPERSAEFAWRDACISHIKNGIYGEMFVAGMISTAFASDDILTIIKSGLAQIPARSRLYENINLVMDWHSKGISYDEALERIHRRYNENFSYDLVHTISNAMIVVIGLLWGNLDYERSICNAVQACFDTDCNGATVGSIIGAVLGAKNLPKKWTKPVHDTLQTGIAGYNMVRISELARETLKIIERIN